MYVETLSSRFQSINNAFCTSLANKKEDCLAIPFTNTMAALGSKLLKV